MRVNFGISIVVIGAVASFAAFLIVRANNRAIEVPYGSDLPQQRTGEVPQLGAELEKINPLPGEQ